MELSVNEVKKIATLARLSLTEEEAEQYAKELSVVLDYVARLDEVDTENIPETTQVTGLENVYREDVPVAIGAQQRKALVDAFPEKVGTVLKVKGVFGAQE